ncbi:hypothetical protein D3C86_1529820 [compost metagenome]
MLEASMEPSAAPAPTTVWSSSMNRMISPSWALISSMMPLRRSSNSPRYLVPATSAPRSSARTRLFLSMSGTSPWTISWARPSAIAVLPTPGSPISTGLFLVRRLRIRMTRSISSSRPITGSSLLVLASSVRSRVYLSRLGVLPPRGARGAAPATPARGASPWGMPRSAASCTIWEARLSPSSIRPMIRCSGRMV